MASVNPIPPPKDARPHHHHHQRSKSSVLPSFVHRRNNSDASALMPSPLSPITTHTQDSMALPDLSRPPALGEIQNQAASGSRSPTRPDRSRSPAKSNFFLGTLKSAASKAPEPKANDDALLPKPKKTKSSTNIAGFLTRPKSLKNLHKLASDAEAPQKKDKENQTPPSSISPQEFTRPPIYAQFSSGTLEHQHGNDVFGNAFAADTSIRQQVNKAEMKQRPKSYHPQSPAPVTNGPLAKTQNGLRNLVHGNGSGTGLTQKDSLELILDPKDVAKHLEDMLDRRNIPENQRYKMRNLSDTIKMEFIRQDWAETRGSHSTRPNSHGSDHGVSPPQDKGSQENNTKKSRGRSFTLTRSRAKKAESTSPVKKSKGEGTLGRHFRTRSTESVASERPSSAGSSSGGGILSKIKLQQGPVDYVNYLRKAQQPELVEVGKLHKLRLLLRNETVTWTEEFIRQGGMEEIVALLYRILAVEWREEHEDALLHEDLLCLKALCTTALAIQYLHSVQATLFPALLNMLFDPEKKGPSEFTTRAIITSVLFTYIRSAAPEDRPARARVVLGHLRDPVPKEEDRPLEFVLEMQRERPYRVWSKEATNVTKEVFWIFLHHFNVVYLARNKEPRAVDSLTYMQTHFPQERPPVPAAPYVGGVEWDATNYLASHLDLLNAIIACTPTTGERNELRSLCRISGWERCMGSSLRLCKEKFYSHVHDGLRTWLAAAAEDGWDVRDVRYGPSEPQSPSKKQASKAKNEPAAPKIDMPKLDLGLDSPVKNSSTDWLS
ncbi:armadillo-type protein [Xylariaceae sp. FL0255]|nr:armadillo-type protein [Xylariaceae sp. FL0255]